jgi:hypothetical protein
MKQQDTNMTKKILLLAISLLTLNFTNGYGQDANEAKTPAAPPIAETTATNQALPQTSFHPPRLRPVPFFNLEFPGGTPIQLVQTIEKAAGCSLNVIIDHEDENVAIPPLKLNNVTVPQLFMALQAASRKDIHSRWGPQTFSTGYGFKNSDTSSPSTSTIWYFFVDRPDQQEKAPKPNNVCRFYSLAPFLEHGYTVEDITTAIQTGWKLEGEPAPPEMNYHKETRLLIACGESEKMDAIGRVLQALPNNKAGHPTQDETDQLKAQLKELQHEVEQLKKQGSTGASGGAGPAEEKSGK